MKKLFNSNTVLSLVFTAIFLAFSSFGFAQENLTKPSKSQKAKVMQQIGLTHMKVIYHSPLTKGRTVWGDLVPYNEVWRCGANENTVFYTSTDVTVEGKTLPAGAYGMHMIPTENDWTVIFSKESKSWGSYVYDETEDALRVTVKPSTKP